MTFQLPKSTKCGPDATPCTKFARRSKLGAVHIVNAALASASTENLCTDKHMDLSGTSCIVAGMMSDRVGEIKYGGKGRAVRLQRKLSRKICPWRYT